MGDDQNEYLGDVGGRYRPLQGALPRASVCDRIWSAGVSLRSRAARSDECFELGGVSPTMKNQRAGNRSFTVPLFVLLLVTAITTASGASAGDSIPPPHDSLLGAEERYYR